MSAPLSARLLALWYRPDRPPWMLRALARVFGAAVRLRRGAYERGWLRTRRLRSPVVVVGNLSVGGSGKTPLVLRVCEVLREQGWRPGIVLRGYGGRAARGREPVRVEPESDPTLVGDEALLLRRRSGLPVVVCPDRVRAGRALQDVADVIVSDDGLQHLALARDCEIVVVDAVRGLGNGHLLPAGPLREPAARLQSVDLLVLNESDAAAADGAGAGDGVDSGTRTAGLPPDLTVATLHMHLHGDRLIPLGDGEAVALSSFAGSRVHAVAGIGHPERFFAALRAAGLDVLAHAMPDHHRYTAADLEFPDALPVLMTEKDAVKCLRFAAANRWYLPVAARFGADDAALLGARLARCLRARRG